VTLPQPPYTYDDLLRTPEDNVRREIFAGVLHVSPSGTPRHQRIVGRIFVAFDAFARANGGEAFAAPLDVVFDRVNTAQPDVFYIAPDRLEIVGPRAIVGPPSLTVEVLAPTNSRHDTVIKMAMYARFGVPEYWIVDPEAERIEQFWDASGDCYCRRATYAGSERLNAATQDGLALAPAETF